MSIEALMKAVGDPSNENVDALKNDPKLAFYLKNMSPDDFAALSRIIMLFVGSSVDRGGAAVSKSPAGKLAMSAVRKQVACTCDIR